METVKIKSCVVKTQGTAKSTGKPYTIYKVVLEDERTGQSFEQLEGECQIEIESKDYNGTPQLTFKKAGGQNKGGSGKSYYKPNPKEKAFLYSFKFLILILSIA